MLRLPHHSANEMPWRAVSVRYPECNLCAENSLRSSPAIAHRRLTARLIDCGWGTSPPPHASGRSPAPPHCAGVHRGRSPRAVKPSPACPPADRWSRSQSVCRRRGSRRGENGKPQCRTQLGEAKGPSIPFRRCKVPNSPAVSLRRSAHAAPRYGAIPLCAAFERPSRVSHAVRRARVRQGPR